MKNINQSGSALIVILALVIVAATGGAGYYVYSTKKGNDTNRTAVTDSVDSDPSLATEVASGDSETKTEASASTEEARQKSVDKVIRNQLTALSGAVSEYVANNSGKLPTSIEEVRTKLSFPEGTFETWQSAGAITSGTPNPETFYYATGHTCDQSTNLMVASPSSRSYAIVALLETGKPYCQE